MIKEGYLIYPNIIISQLEKALINIDRLQCTICIYISNILLSIHCSHLYMKPPVYVHKSKGKAHLNDLPLPELAVLSEQRPEHGAPARVQALVEHLPAALARDVEDAEDADLERLAHRAGHLALELQLDVRLEHEVHVLAGGALRDVRGGVELSVRARAGAGDGGGAGLADERQQAREALRVAGLEARGEPGWRRGPGARRGAGAARRAGVGEEDGEERAQRREQDVEVAAEAQAVALDDEGDELEQRGEDLACCLGSLDPGSVRGTHFDHACERRLDVVLRHGVRVFVEEE